MAVQKELDDRPLDLSLAQERMSNLARVLRSPVAVSRDWLRLWKLRRTLRHQAARLHGGDHITAFHLTLAQDQSDPFPFYASMAVFSAQARHPRARIFLYALREPRGPFWQLVRDRVALIIVPPICWVGFAPLSGPSNWLDIIKLMALIEIGGIAMNSDVIVMRNADDLAGMQFVIGVQAVIPGGRSAFGNAFMAGRRDSDFAAAWLSAYRNFGARGGDLNRDFFSMHLPMHLYALMPDEVTVLTHDRLYFPIIYRIRDFLFNETAADIYQPLLDNQYAIPLWREIIGEELEDWSPTDVIARDCIYAQLCRNVFAALPTTDLLEIADRLELSASALIRSPSGSSVALPVAAEGTS